MDIIPEDVTPRVRAKVFRYSRSGRCRIDRFLVAIEVRIASVEGMCCRIRLDSRECIVEWEEHDVFLGSDSLNALFECQRPLLCVVLRGRREELSGGDGGEVDYIGDDDDSRS